MTVMLRRRGLAPIKETSDAYSFSFKLNIQVNAKATPLFKLPVSLNKYKIRKDGQRMPLIGPQAGWRV